MSDLVEPGQYLIGNVIFGRGTPYQVNSIEDQAYGISAGDYQVPQSDEVRFGQDSHQPSLLAITLGVVDNRILPQFRSQATPLQKATAIGADALVERLAHEWSADDIRGQWGLMKPLIYCNERGDIRALFGRPRKFFSGRKSLKGEFIPVAMEYQRGDRKSYALEPSLVEVLPGSSPTFTQDLERGDGGARTWLTMQITGPIANPKIAIGNMLIEFNYTVAAGESVTIDSTPWYRSVQNNLGVNLQTKMINNSPYLDQLWIPPYETSHVGFGGTGTNASTKLEVVWREAYNTM